MADNINTIEHDYEKFLKWQLDFQKKIGKISFSNLIIISWITCIWKNTFIEKKQLPSLITYKSWNNATIQKKQTIINDEKFHKKMLNWEFFDIYSINWRYYWYAIEDYYILNKEYWKVYIDISIESIYLWLNYTPKKIFILDYPEEQLKENIKKRIQERNYTKERIELLEQIIEREKKFLEIIKKRSNFTYIKTPL